MAGFRSIIDRLSDAFINQTFEAQCPTAMIANLRQVLRSGAAWDAHLWIVDKSHLAKRGQIIIDIGPAAANFISDDQQEGVPTPSINNILIRLNQLFLVEQMHDVLFHAGFVVTNSDDPVVGDIESTEEHLPKRVLQLSWVFGDWGYEREYTPVTAGAKATFDTWAA